MQIEQPLRELFWNPTTAATLPRLVLSLVLAALLGWLVGQVYVRFGHSLSNRRFFARNFLILTVTTTLIISIVKSSLALSLGLVGALSIVRFRAAIKEPEELAYLFLAISVGLGLGAGQVLITVVALLVILGVITLRSWCQRGPITPNFYLTVTSPQPGKLSASQILDALSTAGGTGSLKRFDEASDLLEASLRVDFKDVGSLERFNQRLRELNPGVKVSCLDDRGLAT
jgi:uncharacterized membrane protein YhiD involved in acid resistance